jgi:gliding motility-associated-like protein
MAWTTTDGQILGDATGYTIIVGSAGTYSATLTDNVNGCEVTRVVTVTEDRELPEVVIGSPEEITCTRSMVILSSEGSSTGTEYDYQWMTANGEISGGSTGTTVSATSAGDYTLIITNTENGCVDSTSVSVEENENVVTGVKYTQSGLLCEGSQLATLSFTAEGGVSPYEYSLGEETNGSGVFTDLESGEYTVNVEDANGCVYDSTFMIEDPEDFTAELGGPVQVNEGDSALVTVTYGQDIDVSQIIWETETGEEFSCLNAVCDSIRFEPDRTQILRVIVISSNGCQREDIVQVVVLKDRAVYVPSGFSPNDDGTNDVFLPYGGEKVAGFNYMFITDRWGEKVYEVPAFGRIDEVRGWDGRYNGEKMQPGVYIYETEVVYEDGETKILKGDVTLLR